MEEVRNKTFQTLVGPSFPLGGTTTTQSVNSRTRRGNMRRSALNYVTCCRCCLLITSESALSPLSWFALQQHPTLTFLLQKVMFAQNGLALTFWWLLVGRVGLAKRAGEYVIEREQFCKGAFIILYVFHWTWSVSPLPSTPHDSEAGCLSCGKGFHNTPKQIWGKAFFFSSATAFKPAICIVSHFFQSYPTHLSHPLCLHFTVQLLKASMTSLDRKSVV